MMEPNQIRQTLKECESRFLKAFQQSPLALTLTSATDHRYIEVNDTFEQVTGWKRGEVIGRTPFDIEIWVDPSQRIDLVKELLSGGAIRNLELRARMKNREVRICSGSAALIEINGETCILSLIADITDSTAARLIEAQDKEHTAIARELHNHLERLMLLSAGLDRFQRNVPEAAHGRSEIAEAKRQIEELVANIQALTGRLHSSELEILGLERAAGAFCREVSERKGLEISFISENIPSHLPEKVSLGIFHVLQEAVQNAAHYSGSHQLHVSLRVASNEIQLMVQDSGVGFDPAEALKGPGLGLMIVKERLKLMRGQLSIESEPARGSTIRARIPLNPETGFAVAG